MSESDRWKATVHVGGLASHVTSNHVHDAFIPFGDIVEVSVPKDDRSNTNNTADEGAPPEPTNRGFAYVEFEDVDDAKEAIDNMDQSEFFGKVIRCSAAKAPKSATEGLGSKTALWEQEGWLSQNTADDELSAPMPAAGDPMQGLEGLDVAGPKPV
ncbi:Peptidyl-prolyl cis-trans isomerase E [Ceratocystis platani]|uniref:Peptidyl-prolyl cis-trans isomerase E n=1 Tax=Ceratocystis fimbriata f. sp. platani TaxID=88771 RepID=A0A0F8BXK9_CERFI|nr:Peptidyl-prolyl cis-trans isomerase E [Ceratocystis platani]